MPIPSHLSDAGGTFYRAVADDFDLSLAEETALLQAAETIDVLAALEKSIRETGAVLATGKANPLLIEARQQRNILVRILGLLDLRDDEDEDSKASTSRSARAAARARWSKQRSA